MTDPDDAPAPDDDVVLRALGEAFSEQLGEPPAELVDEATSAFRTRSTHRLAVLTDDTLNNAPVAGGASPRVVRFVWDATMLEVTLDHAVHLRLDPPASLTLMVETTSSRQTVLMPETGVATAAFGGFPLRITALVDEPVTTPWITG